MQLRVQGWVNWDMLNEIEDFRFEALIGFIMSVSFSRKQANKRKSKWWSLLGRVFILRLVHTPVCTCNGLQDPLSTGTKLVRDEQTSWQSGIQVETDGAVDGMSYLPKFLCWNGNHPPCQSQEVGPLGGDWPKRGGAPCWNQGPCKRKRPEPSLSLSAKWAHRERRQLSASREETHKIPNLRPPWSWTEQCPELWEINVCGLSRPVCGILLHRPNGLRQMAQWN